ncbi:sigma-70 family RNA polymerase sigma factor [Pendulispora brunnea]|uniref:Sigma-70 family RNA polymerase sigma factor n=1 Tax=Pendulispora brunnea TaxID=2905690 RepID=A0ABZ2JZF3_9BACT
MLDLDIHLSAIQSGDADAFGQWLAGAERPVRESLRSFAAHLDTEAIVQDVFLRVWELAPRFEPDGAPNGLFRLALRIARNLAISERRRLRTACEDPDDLEARIDDTSLPSVPDPLLRRLIEDCHRTLPEKPALALRARLETGGKEPDHALAVHLSMQKNTFLQNVSRARKLLGECLERRGVRIAEFA